MESFAVDPGGAPTSVGALLSHQHTVKGYYGDHRDCPGCRAAAAAYIARWRKRPARRVATGEVRGHLKALHAGGMSLREIARKAGVSDSRVRDILNGTARRITVETRSKLLGVLAVNGRAANNIPVAPRDGDLLASLRRLLLLDSDTGWMADSECRRDDLDARDRALWFFPRRGEDPTPAKRICARCPVKAPCLAFALETGAVGVWGETTGQERRAIKRART